MWNSHFTGKSIELYEKGEAGLAKVVKRIDMPTNNMTCPGLGGPDMDWLISTSASETSTMEPNMHPVAGSLFVTKVEVKGLPESRFKDIL